MRYDPLRWLLIGFLRAYRLLISPLYGQVCRYHPSCSAYALQAVTERGSVVGSWLTLRRLARCHPWASGGYDPVPPRRHDARQSDRQSDLQSDLQSAQSSRLTAGSSPSPQQGA